MSPAQPHGFTPHQDRVSCFTIDRQRKWKINATLATTSRKISKEAPCHKLITRTMARLVGTPIVRSHPNKNRKMGSGAPKKARLIAVALTTKLTTQKETANRKVLCQVDNSLTIAVPMTPTRSNNIVGRQGERLLYLETLTCLYFQ